MAQRRYYFSVGNSTAGAIGFCASVLAQSKAQAQERLRLVLTPFDASGLKVFDDLKDTPDLEPAPGLEYIRVYFNANAISRAAVCQQGVVSDRDEEDPSP